MSRVIVLDTGPLGLVTNPKLSSESAACAQWLQAHISTGNRIIIPEIADYELPMSFGVSYFEPTRPKVLLVWMNLQSF